MEFGKELKSLEEREGQGQSDLAEKSLPTTTLMVLLRWCTLSPQGPSGLAAILFPSPVKVSSIALFPTGAHPFSQCPDVVAYVQPPSDIRPVMAHFFQERLNLRPSFSMFTLTRLSFARAVRNLS